MRKNASARGHACIEAIIHSSASERVGHAENVGFAFVSPLSSGACVSVREHRFQHSEFRSAVGGCDLTCGLGAR